MHYVRIAPSEIDIRYINAAKTSPTDGSYFNAGFFGDYYGCGTLPVANLLCNLNESVISDANQTALRGWLCTISGNKLYKNSYNPTGVSTPISTFYIDSSNNAYIAQANSVQTTWKCAVSGAPIMKNGVITSITELNDEHWDPSWKYGTWHGCLAVATSSTVGASEFFYVAMETTSDDCRTGEAYNIVNSLNLGIQNAIILDGGTSFIFKYNGTTRETTGGTRPINNIMYF
ncbi:hypothetical protein SDC9_141080 [bioreactor metagenome]|uniref:Uncharacterized protein n=1 Tax=bioreactor metagenome TaxID=1076179 RepID=A0A645DXT0_9ZZZZ